MTKGNEGYSDIEAWKRAEAEKFDREERKRHNLPGTGKRRKKPTNVTPKKKKRK